MKLQKVIIRNFKSIKEIEFEFPKSGLLVLVGENNSGKSNIIRSIEAICGEGWYGKDKLEDRDYYTRDCNKIIEVFLYFDDGKSFHFKPTPKDWGTSYFLDWEQTRRAPWGSSIKDDFPCTYLGADRTLDKHLSFYDWTLIGRIRRTFHKKITDETRKKLDGKFEEIVSLFAEVEGFEKFKKDFSNSFDELSPYSRSKLKIDFKPFTPSNYFKTLHILAQETALDNKIIDLDEMGEGSRNLILLALLRSYAKNLKGKDEVTGILALEEPELFLHPHARRHLFSILREIAESGIQVVISTHSSSFIDTEYFDEIGRVVKIPNVDDGRFDETKLILKTKAELVEYCIKTGVPQEKVNEDSITEYYKTTSNARLSEGFFSKCLILVEGETEELCIPEYLRHLGVNCDALGISIIGVNGKNQLPKYFRLYSLFQIPIIIVFDNDNTDGKEKSNKNISKCFRITSDEIIKFEEASKTIFVECEHGDAVSLLVLKSDFETCLKQEIGTEIYNNYEALAINVIKPLPRQQKGVIARYVCRKLIEDNPEYTPSFILEIRKLLKDFIPIQGEEEGETSTNRNSNLKSAINNTDPTSEGLEDLPF